MVTAPILTETSVAIGIDIGGTKVNAARIHLQHDGGTFEFKDIQRVSTPEQTMVFMGTLVELCQGLQDGAEKPVTCIGVSTAGIVNPWTGQILGSTGNLPAITDHPFSIKGPLEEKTGLFVHVENDANAAAYGEYKIGAARGHDNVLMITLGTGVGTGMVLNGQLIRGSHFSAGEGGHITVSMNNDRLATTGLYDCWEAYASGPGLEETARRMLQTNPNSPEAIELIGDIHIERVTTHHVIHAWKGGNKLARDMIVQWHHHIAAGLGGLINLLDPEVSVIGGGMAQFVDYELLQEALSKRVMNASIDQVKVVPATLGNQAGMIGAAYLALEHLNPGSGLSR